MILTKNFKKISCDLDGVMASLIFGKVWRKKPAHAVFQTNKLWKIFDFLENLWMILTENFRQPILGSKEALQGVKKESLSLYLLTSRSKNLIPATEHWLKKFDLYNLFDKNFFNQKYKSHKEFKAEIIKKENIDLHIDDDLETLDYLSDLFPEKTFVYFNLYNNRYLKKKNVFEIKNWKEFYLD